MFVNVTGASEKYILCFTLLTCPKQNPGLTHGVAFVGFFTDEDLRLYMLSVAPTQCHASLTAPNKKAAVNLWCCRCPCSRTEVWERGSLANSLETMQFSCVPLAPAASLVAIFQGVSVCACACRAVGPSH